MTQTDSKDAARWACPCFKMNGGGWVLRSKSSDDNIVMVDHMESGPGDSFLWRLESGVKIKPINCFIQAGDPVTIPSFGQTQAEDSDTGIPGYSFPPNQIGRLLTWNRTSIDAITS